MKKQLKGLLEVNKTDLLAALGLTALPLLLVHIVTAGVMLILRPDESIMIGGMMLPFSVGLAAYTVTAGNVQITFSQAIRFSCNRRRALGLVLSLSGTLTAAALALAAALVWFERVCAMHLWRVLSRRPDLLVDDFGFVWWSLPLGAAIGFALGLIYAAGVLRFGGKAVWGYLFVWLGGMTVFQLLPWKTHEITNILIPVLAVLAVAAVIWSVWTLLRLSITK